MRGKLTAQCTVYSRHHTYIPTEKSLFPPVRGRNCESSPLVDSQIVVALAVTHPGNNKPLWLDCYELHTDCGALLTLRLRKIAFSQKNKYIKLNKNKKFPWPFECTCTVPRTGFTHLSRLIYHIKWHPSFNPFNVINPTFSTAQILARISKRFRSVLKRFTLTILPVAHLWDHTLVSENKGGEMLKLFSHNWEHWIVQITS